MTILRVVAIQPPTDVKGYDLMFWVGSRRGEFSVKSAYETINENQHAVEALVWNLAWKWKGPQCIKTFIWLVIHDRLKTKAEVIRRHILMDNSYERCGIEVETTLHVLRDCLVAKRVWNQFIPSTRRHQFYSLN